MHRGWKIMSDKLLEARYFIEQMISNEAHHLPFKYNLSAFLSASRSVMQLLHAKGFSVQGFQAWYDQQMLDPLLRFFRNTRDFSVHEGQLSLDAATQDGAMPVVHILKNVSGSYTMLASVHLDESKELNPIVLVHQTGNIEYRTNFCWAFSDYPEDIDLKNEVLELCNDYLQRIETCAIEANRLFCVHL